MIYIYTRNKDIVYSASPKSQGYCIAGDVDKAFALLKEMKQLGHVQPDEAEVLSGSKGV